MEQFVEEKWRDKATVQQIFFLLIGAMIGLTTLQYKGPVFGTWYGDVLIVMAFLVTLYFMRKHDQLHQERMKRLDEAPVEIINAQEIADVIKPFTRTIADYVNWMKSDAMKEEPEQKREYPELGRPSKTLNEDSP